MNHPESAVMLATLLELVTHPSASNETRRKIVKHAYELGRIEGRFEGVVQACSQIGKPRAVAS